MNFDSLTCSLSQISHLITSFSKRTFKQNGSEISNIVEKCGIEAERHLFRCLFSGIEFNISGDVNKLFTTNLQINYLNQELNNLSAKSSFATTVCAAIENPFSHQKSLAVSKDLLHNISKVLSLSKTLELLVGIAAKKSCSHDLKKIATEYLDLKLPAFVQLYSEGGKKAAEEIKLLEIPTEALHVLFTEISRNKSLTLEQKTTFIAAYKKENQLVERHPNVLLPLINGEDLHREKVLSETSMPSVTPVTLADIIIDHGYSSCSTKEECRRIFEQYSLIEVSAVQVARCICMMALNSSESLNDVVSFKTMQATGWTDMNLESEKRWNMSVFIEVVKEMNPQMTARDVIAEMDQAGVVLPDVQALHVIIEATKLLSSTTGESPFDLFLKNWKHFKAQFSIIEMCIKNNQLYWFSDNISRPVDLHTFKQPIDEENKDFAIWKSLDMVECLLNLSERDCLRSKVESLFHWPIKNCPDLFAYSLLQSTPSWPTLKSDCILSLLQFFVGSHPNSVVVFQEVWAAQTVPEKAGHPHKLITRSMAEWFMKNEQPDQCKLSRILELAQETKTLSTLLNERPFSFVIDLAALASKREYLKLDKWVSDKLAEHGHEFFAECVKFLKRHFPELPGKVTQGSSGSFNFLYETLPIMITSLQRYLTSNIGKANPDYPENTQWVMNSSAMNLKPVRASASALEAARAVTAAAKARAAVASSSTTATLPSSVVPQPTPPVTSAVVAQPAQPKAVEAMPLSAIAASKLPPASVSNLPAQMVYPSTPTAARQQQAKPIVQPNQQQQASLEMSNNSVDPIGTPAASVSTSNSQFHLQQMNSSSLPMPPPPQAPPSTTISPFSQQQQNHQQQQALKNGGGTNQNPLLQGFGSNAYLGGLPNNNASSSSSVQPSINDPLMSILSPSTTTGGSAAVPGTIGSGGGGFNKFDSFPTNPDYYQSLVAFSAANKNSEMASSSLTNKPAETARYPAGMEAFNNLVLQKREADTSAVAANFRQPNTSAPPPGPDGMGYFSPLSKSSSSSLAAKATAAAADGSWPDMNRSFSKEIEDRANSYFQRIYNVSKHPVTVDDILELLQKFKESEHQHEREVFNCMMRNLFEEYRFFPQYPDKELKITACLFGGVIQKDLVAYMPLGIALRYVLEALRKPRGNKMFSFGIAALDRFKTKLKEYPHYCLHITKIPHFEHFPTELRKYVEFGKDSADPQTSQSADAVAASIATEQPTSANSNNTINNNSLPSNTSSAIPTAVLSATSAAATATAAAVKNNNVAQLPSLTPQPQQQQQPTPQQTTTSAALAIKENQQPSIAKATNISTLTAQVPEEKIPKPADMVQEKVAFIFNNLSMSNLNPKAEELRGLVVTDHLKWIKWLAQYLVMKRVSIEPNFHNLYSNFVDNLDIEGLRDLVSEEAFRNIQVLLKCDKTSANFSDRSLLKNLGHFLGTITIAKNKPILHRELDIRSLLWEANFKGAHELLYVVPFVAKIFESVAKSRIFKLPNPYTTGILSILKELHSQTDLKLHLKFEIEVLCKNLQIEINDLVASEYLKNPDIQEKLKEQLSTTAKSSGSGSAGPAASLSKPATPSDQIIEVSRSMEYAASQVMSGIKSQQVIPYSGGGGGNTTPQPLQQQQQQAVANAAAPPTPTVSVVQANQLPQQQQTPQQQAAQPQQPAAQPAKFAYNDINIYSLPQCTASHVTIKAEIPLLQQVPQLSTCVKPAVERSITDVIGQTIEKSVKLAVTTTEQIVRKDFALDSDEFRMQNAAHQMVKNLASGMGLTYCREQLLNNLVTNIKTSFVAVVTRGTGTLTAQQKEMVDQACNVLAADNVELACCFIQKTCVEKAIMELDKRLMPDYEMRKQARQDGRRFCDPKVLTYQAERMSEPIRLKVGGVTMSQMAVYDEFGKSIPGFQNNNETAQNANFNHHVQPNWAVDEMAGIYEKCLGEIELTKQALAMASNPLYVKLQALHEMVKAVKNTKDAQMILPLVQKVVESLLDTATLAQQQQQQQQVDTDMLVRFRNCHLSVLKTLQDNRLFGLAYINKEVTKTITSHREDQYSVEIIELLLRANLLDVDLFDQSLAQLMERGMNYQSVVFAFKLIKSVLVDDKLAAPVTETKFIHTLEVLGKITATRRDSLPLALPALLEQIRANYDLTMEERNKPQSAAQIMQKSLNQVIEHERRVQKLAALMGSGRKKAKEFDDPPGFVEKVEVFMREWINIYHSPNSGRDSSKGFSAFVRQLQQHKILQNEDRVNRFFRNCTEMFVEMTYKLLQQDTNINQALINPSMVRSKCFHFLDAYVRLIVLMIKLPNSDTSPGTRVSFLNKILGVIIGVLTRDHDSRATEFHQMPYHRILIMLFFELTAPEHFLDTLSTQILTAFTNAFHLLRPCKVPGFMFAWLELISYRGYLMRMLSQTTASGKPATNVKTTWPMYHSLLIGLFKFLSPFLCNVEIQKSTEVMYRGSLRLILVLLHDFPEFLCGYHFAFCDAIPANCIQLRNLILSAFPRNMRLPDPFTPNLRVDMLNEINQNPVIMSNIMGVMEAQFSNNLDSYLNTRSPVSFLADIRPTLQQRTESGEKYNVPLINSLVLYVGIQAINQMHQKGITSSMSSITHSAHMDIFQNLSVDLDTEGRYLFLNAIANQLRYPNAHTHYFSCTLLYLFSEANQEAIQEQITRVLLERLIVNRPHPWGLLITFIELIKNPTFKFWSHDFVNCAPEITKLFDSVARSCTGKAFSASQNAISEPDSIVASANGNFSIQVSAPMSS